MVKHVPHYLRSLYLNGLTIRQIGTKVGCSHFKVWWLLRKLQGHTDMVTSILIKRVVTADIAYAVTRTRAKKRRLKHTLAMLRQRRPEFWAQLIERSRPKSCKGCAREIQARMAAGMWAWSCTYCGTGGFEKPESIAALLRGAA